MLRPSFDLSLSALFTANQPLSVHYVCQPTTHSVGGHRDHVYYGLSASLFLIFFSVSVSSATVCMSICVMFKVYSGFLYLVWAFCERDVRMQMCSSLADNDIYMEDHSVEEQTCRFCLKKGTER